MVFCNLAITLYTNFQARKGNEIDRLEVEVIFCLVIFLFNQTKAIAVLEPRTGHFLRTSRLRGHGQGQVL